MPLVEEGDDSRAGGTRCRVWEGGDEITNIDKEEEPNRKREKEIRMMV